MKHYTLLIAFCFLIMNGFAEDNNKGQTPESVAKSKTEKLALKLMLSAKQKETVYNICLKALQQKETAIALKAKDKQAFQAKMKEVEEDAYKQLIAILTPAQKSKLDKLKTEQEEKYKTRGPVLEKDILDWM